MSELQLLKEALLQCEAGETAIAFDTVNQIVRSANATPQSLLIAAAILHKCGAPNGDIVGILERVLKLEPANEFASVAIVYIFLDAAQFGKAIEEIDRLVTLTGTGRYEEVAKYIYEVFDWPLQEEDDDENEPHGLKSRASRGLKPRYSRERNPDDQLRRLEKRQRDIRSKGHKGIIDSKKKSEQDLETELKRIKSVVDAHESPVTYSRDDEESDSNNG